MYLLDTNIVSDFVRNPVGIVAHRIFHADRLVVTSVIVAGELRFGAEKRRSRRLSDQVNAALAAIRVLQLETAVDIFYGRLRADLTQRGVTIGNNDMWIAAHALSLDATLVTDNTREFARVEGLTIEDWLRD